MEHSQAIKCVPLDAHRIAETVAYKVCNIQIQYWCIQLYEFEFARHFTRFPYGGPTDR